MPPVTAAAEMLTVEDYRATPEGTRYQLVEGELILMAPAPNLYHQDIAGRLYTLIANFLEKKNSLDNLNILHCFLDGIKFFDKACANIILI